jgi:hypothetical protein
MMEGAVGGGSGFSKVSRGRVLDVKIDRDPTVYKTDKVILTDIGGPLSIPLDN